jgi:hypothetical protein
MPNKRGPYTPGSVMTAPAITVFYEQYSSVGSEAEGLVTHHFFLAVLARAFLFCWFLGLESDFGHSGFLQSSFTSLSHGRFVPGWL